MNPDVAAKKAKLAELRAKNLSRQADVIVSPRSPSSTRRRTSAEAPSIALTSTEKAEILASSKFQTFLDRSSKVVEKALSTDIDVLHDYGSSGEGGIDASKFESGSRSCLSISRKRSHKEGEGRPVTSIKANYSRPELFLSSYGRVSGQYCADAPPGLVCVWSDLLLTRPEFVFHAPSPVLTADFHSAEPHLIVGACQSGQVLLWDLRSRSKAAVKRSSPSANGCHTSPVYGLRMVGEAESSRAVFSCDMDGGLSSWRVGQADLSAPSQAWKMKLNATPTLEAVQCGTFSSKMTLSSGPLSTMFSGRLSAAIDDCHVAGEGNAHTLDLACMALSSAHHDCPRSLFFGTSQGLLCRAQLPIQDHGTFTCISAHPSYLSSVESHPSSKKTFRNLLLTASFDWTVRLWCWDESPAATAATASGGRGVAPSAPQLLQEIRGSTFDYVADAKWCPTNPALFACAHAGGHVALWDLSRGTSEPVGTIMCGAGIDGAGEGTALNALEWSSDGQRLFCGDGTGNVYELSVQKQVTTPFEEAARRAEANVQLWRARAAQEALRSQQAEAPEDDF